MHVRTRSIVAALLLAAAPALVACGGDDAEDEAAAAVASAADGGIATVSPAEAQAVIDASPAGLAVLDVRTPEEYAEGHLAGATLIDFYEPDFADQIAALDRDTPYVVYCRSGNRSGQTIELMRQLGFTDVTDVDGGILAWVGAGLPVTTG